MEAERLPPIVADEPFALREVVPAVFPKPLEREVEKGLGYEETREMFCEPFRLNWPKLRLPPVEAMPEEEGRSSMT